MVSRPLRFTAALLGVAALVACTGAPSATNTVSGKDYSITMNELPIYPREGFVAGSFTQQIDHDATSVVDGGWGEDFGSDGGPALPSTTFEQRYWYNTSFAQGPQSPVLFYLCGEAECSENYGYSLGDTAKALSASIVVLEHRYYGQSQPFPGPHDVNAMKYLTLHQALEDAAAFAQFARTNLPLGGKWIAVGGSYPGMLAAFLRLTHPETVVGAWASSAPVNMVLGFPGYDAVAATALGPTCDLLFQQALDAASHAYDDPSQRTALSLQLWGVPDLGGTKADFLEWISSIAAGDAQYGKTRGLCAALLQEQNQPLQALIDYRNPPLAPDPQSDGGTPDADPDAGAFAAAVGHPAVLKPAMPFVRAPTTSDFTGNEWFYQVCSEVGFYQVANPNRTLSIKSELDTVDYWNGLCSSFLGSTPDVSIANARYYQPLLEGAATNILFVNGSLDPWSTLSFIDPGNTPPGITAFVVQTGSHCEDLDNLSPSSVLGVFKAHKLFFDLAQQWLNQ